MVLEDVGEVAEGSHIMQLYLSVCVEDVVSVIGIILILSTWHCSGPPK